KAPSSIDFISTSFSAETPSSIVPDAPDDDDALIDYPDAPSIDPTFCNRVPESKICNKVPINTTNVDPEILRTCNGGPHVIEDCIEILSKLFEGPFDVVKALEIEVNTTGNIVKDIFDVIVKLRNDPSTDKRSKDAFDKCRDQYDMMLDLINQTLEILIPQQNFVDAYEKMAALLSYKDICGISLALASPMVVMPWVNIMPWDKVEVLRDTTYICDNILNNIINNHKF
ncbi:pectinesterase inhibitor, partial [Trifolium medium]|nr:pectinesterase inhibitor [Trifolium medium]